MYANRVELCNGEVSSHYLATLVREGVPILVLVARDDESRAIVGFLIANVQVVNDVRYTVVDALCAQAAGTELMLAFILLSTTLGAQRIYLHALAPVISFYMRFGFKRMPIRSDARRVQGEDASLRTQLQEVLQIFAMPPKRRASLPKRQRLLFDSIQRFMKDSVPPIVDPVMAVRMWEDYIIGTRFEGNRMSHGFQMIKELNVQVAPSKNSSIIASLVQWGSDDMDSVIRKPYVMLTIPPEVYDRHITPFVPERWIPPPEGVPLTRKRKANASRDGLRILGY